MSFLKRLFSPAGSLFCATLLFFSVSGVGYAEAALQCYDCHGTKADNDIRPLDSAVRSPSTGGFLGNHRTHMKPGAGAASCQVCHPDSSSYTPSHRNGQLKISSHLNSSNPVTTYNNSTTAWYQTATPVLGSCSNVNCHFENTTPVWGSSPSQLTCSSCHASPPADGSHGKKHAVYFGNYTTSCAKCHPNHSKDANIFSHATSAGHRGLKVQFTTSPNSGGSYTGGSNSYPAYLPSSNPPRNGSCTDIYCHSNGSGGPPNRSLTWSDSRTTTCYTCHGGRPGDSTSANCVGFGVWSAVRGTCTPDLTMSSNGHHRLVGAQWIRKYPCSYCHYATTDLNGQISDVTKHVNGDKNVVMNPRWNIGTRPAASYNPSSKVCDNVYCHSDGTTDPEAVRPFAWTEPKTSCNTCHGHAQGTCSTTNCHDGLFHADTQKVWPVKTTWPSGQEWMSAMPMYKNEGAGLPRANSHARHIQTNFTCDICHADTIINGACTTCHISGIPKGSMSEVSHLNGLKHVDGFKTVKFSIPTADYKAGKTCVGTGTGCHTDSTDPVWGGSVNSTVTCFGCHRGNPDDVDDFAAFNGTRARINEQQWLTAGHGRYSTSGRYPVSGNPAANFPANNACWYCHDNSVLHNDPNNPYRLQMHHQYERRFEKECVYCHMERKVEECQGCHVGQTESLAPQTTGSGIIFKLAGGGTETRYQTHTYTSGCLTAGTCHDSDSGTFGSGAHKGHNTGAGVWTAEQKSDVKNQYLMMGVCLQCHDDDSGGQCTECHTAPQDNPLKYSLGFNGGSGFIKPKKARATSAHFGYKHYRIFLATGGWTKDGNGKVIGTWKGGKFCWDCHDPHGDTNIYMIHSKVATSTDGKFGIPKTRADVVFTDKVSGTSYARKEPPFNGICNVCHEPGNKHYTSNSGDGHNYTRLCTNCHEHRFTDSHANKQACNSCHSNNKPIPKHTAFGLPRDCTKCHSGTIGKRMDVMGQMKANSHHVQGVEVTNKHCYACHWEATKDGLIDTDYHAGYNYRTYTSVKNEKVDLVLWGAGIRPTEYREYSTAAGRATVSRFLAAGMGTGSERAEVTKISSQCISCHSDQNNETQPFGDYRTPRQYAWDYQSVASRYQQQGTTRWGKYSTATSNGKQHLTKAMSAHGNAVSNQGGWSASTGYDGAIPLTRGIAGTQNVQCFDCHNSHGSKVVGTTTSYVTFNGTNNGGNLKETKQSIGGYSYDYKASSNSEGINPFGAGAGQCFDCHNSAASGTATPNGKTPWGYNSTFGASAPILGYKDTPRFGQGVKASTSRFSERNIMQTIVGGHLQASFKLNSTLPHLAKAAGTASGGSATTLTDSAKGWTTNAWKDLYLQMTGGINAGQMRKITGNSSTTLTVEAEFTAPVTTGDGYQVVPYTATVNGLCTPCHDPHGVSPVLGNLQNNAVPLLKGSWLTSPYKEDQPAPDPTGTYVTNFPDGTPQSWGQGFWGKHPTPTQPYALYNLDRTTFGGLTRISEQDNRFAGLCTNCHRKEMLTDGINKNKNFGTVDRIHESVKGWGANTEHSYSCSKCHQPHNSGLPRLMQTNCLDAKHRGNRASGGAPWSVDSEVGTYYGDNRAYEHRGYPIASTYGNSANYEATTSCHGSAPLNSGSWPDKNRWNKVTPW